MFRKIFFAVSFILASKVNLYSQKSEYKYSECKLKFHSKENTTMSSVLLKAELIEYPFNPILLIESKKLYAGVKKEINKDKYT